MAAINSRKLLTSSTVEHKATRRWLLVFNYTARLWVLDLVYKVSRLLIVSTHSHPKVAACIQHLPFQAIHVSTHSHPKVAAQLVDKSTPSGTVSTHSHPKVAAERCMQRLSCLLVSTHSHPKVAATFVIRHLKVLTSFNTQPPEGGC